MFAAAQYRKFKLEVDFPDSEDFEFEEWDNLDEEMQKRKREWEHASKKKVHYDKTSLFRKELTFDDSDYQYYGPKSDAVIYVRKETVS